MILTTELDSDRVKLNQHTKRHLVQRMLPGTLRYTHRADLLRWLDHYEGWFTAPCRVAAVSCYVYHCNLDGPWRVDIPPSAVFSVPNVTAQPSSAGVPIVISFDTAV